MFYLALKYLGCYWKKISGKERIEKEWNSDQGRKEKREGGRKRGRKVRKNRKGKVKKGRDCILVIN